MSNRDKIIEAATDLFHFHGYDGTSIDMLIKAASVSKSNFYYYFEGKEELGLEVIKIITDFYGELSSQTLLRKDLHPLIRLHTFYKKIFDYQRSQFLKTSKYQGSFFGNMALEQSVKNEKFRSAVENHFRECEASVEACIKECWEQGIFYEGLEPKQITRLLITQFEGAMLMAKLHNSFEPIEELYEQMQKIMVKEEWLHLFEPPAKDS